MSDNVSISIARTVFSTTRTTAITSTTTLNRLFRTSSVALLLGVSHVVTSHEVSVLALGGSVVRPLQDSVHGHRAVVTKELTLLVGGRVVVDVLAAVLADTSEPVDSSVAREVAVGAASDAEHGAHVGSATSGGASLVGGTQRLDEATTGGSLEAGEVVVVDVERDHTTLRVSEQTKRGKTSIFSKLHHDLSILIVGDVQFLGLHVVGVLEIFLVASPRRSTGAVTGNSHQTGSRGAL